MAYYDPLRSGASASDFKAVIKFLDDRANCNKEHKRLAHRHREETPGKEKRSHNVKPFMTDITGIEDKWALVRIMVNHKCYLLAGATETNEVLDKMDSDGTVSVTMLRPNTSLTSREKNPAPSGQGLPSTARPRRRRDAPQLPPNLKKAYYNPTSAEVDALKGVIKFLDERGNDYKKNTKISMEKKAQRNVAKKRRRTNRETLPVKTAIPDMTDEEELKRELACL
ncbi:hypothetical protein H0H93_016747, partial [Arthromyces matolae]